MKASPWQGKDAADFSRTIDDPCIQQNVGRRRIFWVTQQNVCGDYIVCGRECAIPGLKYVEDDSSNPEVPGGRSIDNHNWLLGLILNILNTRARNDARCPSPTAVYGHWSESYRDDGLHIGTRMWNAAEKKYVRVADSVKAVQAAIQSDMTKLVMLGLVDNVEVDAQYRGSNMVEVIITAIKANARHVLNLSGTFVADTWVWN